jgi:biotin carboxyl carrier protein
MLLLGGRRIVTQITSRLKKHLKAGEECNIGCLAAPMHGLVVDVPVHAGDTVEKGQTLVVLESMKMQMQLRSPRPGILTKVVVQSGDQVEKGALLVQFE